MTLSDVKVNSYCVITKVDGAIKRRLLDMGFTPGSRLEVVGSAPFGSAVLIRIRGIEIALRESASKVISVEEIK